MKDPFKPFLDDDYRDEAFLDIKYNGYVYIGAYPNGSSVSCETTITQHPRGTIIDLGQATFGKIIECRPTVRHPAKECGRPNKKKITYQWHTEAEYFHIVCNEPINLRRTQ